MIVPRLQKKVVVLKIKMAQLFVIIQLRYKNLLMTLLLSSPVCGSNGQNYSSSCALERESCVTGESVTVLHAGLCRAPAPSCSR